MKFPGWLFDRDRNDLTAWQVIRWWEIRRFIYNVLVGLVGIFTCAIALIMGLLVESHGGVAIFPNPPLFAVVAVILYGIAANICYTTGWICELVSRRLWPIEATAFGRLSFIYGLIGSVILTLLPALFIIILSIIEMFVNHSKLH